MAWVEVPTAKGTNERFGVFVARPKGLPSATRRQLVLERWFATSSGHAARAERVLVDHCAQKAAIIEAAIREVDMSDADHMTGRQLVEDLRTETRAALAAIRPLGEDDVKRIVAEYEVACKEEEEE